MNLDCEVGCLGGVLVCEVGRSGSGCFGSDGGGGCVDCGDVVSLHTDTDILPSSAPSVLSSLTTSSATALFTQTSPFSSVNIVHKHKLLIFDKKYLFKS